MKSEEFVEVRLGEVADIIAGQSPKSENYTFDNKFTPFLQGNKTFGDVYPSIEIYTKRVTKLAKKDDILISVRAPVGDLNIANQNICMGRGLAAIRAKKCDFKYLYYFLKQNNANLIFYGNGTTYDSISIDILKNIKFKIHKSLKTQKQIASILSVIDEKIELNKKINKKLEEIAKLLYNYYFVQFDFPDKEGKPYKSSGGEMVYSKELKREIPKGWDVKNLLNSKITEIINPDIDSFRNNKIYLSTSDVENTEIINHNNFIKFENRPSRANMQPIKNSIWFARMKDTKKYILVSDFSNELINNYIFSTGFAGIKVKEKALYYVWNFITSDYFDTLKNIYATGSTQKAIINEAISKIYLLIPDDKILNRFYEICKPIYKQIYINQLQIQKLNILRDFLLPVLLNGQVKIKENS